MHLKGAQLRHSPKAALDAIESFFDYTDEI